jgi:hypothetical protein
MPALMRRAEGPFSKVADDLGKRGAHPLAQSRTASGESGDHASASKVLDLAHFGGYNTFDICKARSSVFSLSAFLERVPCGREENVFIAFRRPCGVIPS